MVDYQWNKDDGNERSTTARTIKTPPKTLLFQLNRFEFDLTLLQQRKLDSRFEFPHVLDLAPFLYKPPPTDGARPRTASDADLGEGGPVLYDLAGVVVHSGTIYSGHYYSFVREDEGSWVEYRPERTSC